MWSTLQAFVRLEVWLLLIGFFSVVGNQMLTGKINMRGLLVDKEEGGLSPGRAQMLIVTLVGAMVFLGEAVKSAAQSPPALPNVPNVLLWATGGSQAIYLLGKARNIIKRLFK